MENMKKITTNSNETNNLEIPQIDLLNVYKLGRRKIYEKHKLFKRTNKETRA